MSPFLLVAAVALLATSLAQTITDAASDSPPGQPITLAGGNHLFTGACGTRFSFPGRREGSFCVLSAARLHVNARLRGYEAMRPPLAGLGPDGGMGMSRTWIKELGVLWAVPNPKDPRRPTVHRLHLVARSGKLHPKRRQSAPPAASKGKKGSDAAVNGTAEPFLLRVGYNNKQLPVPFVMGEVVEGAGGSVLATNGSGYSAGVSSSSGWMADVGGRVEDGRGIGSCDGNGDRDGCSGFTLRLEEVEKFGQFAVERYELAVADVARMIIRARVAHPMLQTPTDSQAHFSVEFLLVDASPGMHGVLGQTYQQTRERAAKVAEVVERARRTGLPVMTDEEAGKGFLDGEVEDYESSHIGAPNCKFTRFGKK
ncbi:unnamed protein product [Closterium sp. NIES-53]